MIPLKDVAAHIRNSIPRVKLELEEATRAHAEFGAKLAHGYIGHLQGPIGISSPVPLHVPAWPPLAPATIDDKVALGFGPPDYEPLLRTGEYRQSIAGASLGLTGVIGSSDPVSPHHEFGTMNMPARPVLARAMVEMLPLLHTTLGMIGMSALNPSRP